jgi:hypothetical protein
MFVPPYFSYCPCPPGQTVLSNFILLFFVKKQFLEASNKKTKVTAINAESHAS